MEAITFFSHLSHWQIDFLTFGLLLLSTIFTLIPEELLFVTLGYLAHCGRIHSLEAIFVAKLGLIPADALTLWIGRKLGKNILNHRPFRFLFAEETVNRSLEKFKKSGGVLLFFTRFTPFLRAPVYVAAGISGFSLRRSIGIDLLAACIQVPALFLVGFIFGKSAQPFVTLFTYLTLTIALIFGIVSIAKPIIQSRRRCHDLS